MVLNVRECAFNVGPERLHLGLKVGLPVVFAGSSMFFVRSLLIVVDLFVSYFVILLCYQYST